LTFNAYLGQYRSEDGHERCGLQENCATKKGYMSKGGCGGIKVGEVVAWAEEGFSVADRTCGWRIVALLKGKTSFAA